MPAQLEPLITNPPTNFTSLSPLHQPVLMAEACSDVVACGNALLWLFCELISDTLRAT